MSFKSMMSLTDYMFTVEFISIKEIKKLILDWRVQTHILMSGSQRTRDNNEGKDNAKLKMTQLRRVEQA